MKYLFFVIGLLICSSVYADHCSSGSCGRASGFFRIERVERTERVRIFVREDKEAILFPRVREVRILPRNWGK